MALSHSVLSGSTSVYLPSVHSEMIEHKVGLAVKFAERVSGVAKPKHAEKSSVSAMATSGLGLGSL